MLNQAGFFSDDHYKFWAEAMNTALKLDNILVKPSKIKCSNEKFFKSLPGYSNHLVPFGKLAIVGNLEKQPKIENKGNYHIMMGYAENAPSDTYCLFNIATKNHKIKSNYCLLLNS